MTSKVDPRTVPINVDFIVGDDGIRFVWSGLYLAQSTWREEFMPGLKRYIGMSAAHFQNTGKASWLISSDLLDTYDMDPFDVVADMCTFMREYFKGRVVEATLDGEPLEAEE